MAVLPFQNLSTDPENEFFADGITEDVIAQLSKIRSLKVIGRGSVMRFKNHEQSLREIGIVLDVTTLLEGSVRRAGSRVRIVAQLIDAETDRPRWAETYDRDLTDIFAIQTDVAVHIADALEAELTYEERNRLNKEPTDDLQAYQLYLQAKHCLTRWTQEGTDQALKNLGEAVKRDTSFALAYATIAWVYLDLGLGVAGALPPSEAFERSRAAVARALELDPQLAEAHAVLGHLKYACDYDWAGGEAELKRAIELNPNSGEAYDFYGLLLSSLERYDEAIEMQTRAHAVDPLAHRMDIVTTYLRAGRYDEALRSVIRVIDVEPHLALAHLTLGWVYLLTGKKDEGIASVEKAVSLSRTARCISPSSARPTRRWAEPTRPATSFAAWRPCSRSGMSRRITWPTCTRDWASTSARWTGWRPPTSSGRVGSSGSRDPSCSRRSSRTHGSRRCSRR